MSRLISLLFLFLLPVPASAGGDEERPVLTPAQEAECLARGGRVAVAGILGGTFCAEPAPDAGKACVRASDCSVRCEAETRTCATHANPFGCHRFLDEDGEEQSLCVD